ncbi:hypothetical protein [Tetragenococcus solitarius]|uniref:Uncharacterized protein n=1 Tax=Tetragenococcus solitarius TaxID=71453 RepID=A0ABP6KK99_9ENTE|nr:hypothetical protein [Tetragenococcus solitarius]
MNKKQAALFLYLLEVVVFDREFHLQQSVVFETKNCLITGLFYAGDSFFAPFKNPEAAYTFKETFVKKATKYGGTTDYNKVQIQEDLQENMSATFEKIKYFVLRYDEFEEISDTETIITDDMTIKNVHFLNGPNQIFPFYIFSKDITFKPVSLLFDPQ